MQLLLELSSICSRRQGFWDGRFTILNPLHLLARGNRFTTLKSEFNCIHIGLILKALFYSRYISLLV